MDCNAANEIATHFNIAKIDKLIEKAANEGNYRIDVHFARLPHTISNYYIKAGYKVFWVNQSLCTLAAMTIDWHGETIEERDKKLKNIDEEKKQDDIEDSRIDKLIDKLVSIADCDKIASIHDCDNDL